MALALELVLALAQAQVLALALVLVQVLALALVLERFWDLRINNFEVKSDPVPFNQVKIIRVTDIVTENGANASIVHVNELQVFIGNTNIARNGTTSSNNINGYKVDGRYYYDISQINDGVVEFSSEQAGWLSERITSDPYHLNTYGMITLDSNYDVNDIQYIVVHYQYSDFPDRIKDCNIQLLLDGVLISEVGPTIFKLSHEIAGPAVNTFDPNMFTNSFSESGSKLYRPLDSNDINTNFSFSQIVNSTSNFASFNVK